MTRIFSANMAREDPNDVEAFASLVRRRGLPSPFDSMAHSDSVFAARVSERREAAKQSLGDPKLKASRASDRKV